VRADARRCLLWSLLRSHGRTEHLLDEDEVPRPSFATTWLPALGRSALSRVTGGKGSRSAQQIELDPVLAEPVVPPTDDPVEAAASGKASGATKRRVKAAKR
jgi:hypothetical protein